jgi:hypothetical protein
MRSVLFSQLLLTLSATVVHLIIALVDKSMFVLPEAAENEEDLTDERRMLVQLISQRTDYRQGMMLLLVLLKPFF